MLDILIISVGKKHDPLLASAIDHYENRIKHFAKLNWLLVPSSDTAEESMAISQKLKSGDTVVLLDEVGKAVSNQDLAEIVDAAQNQSAKRLVFIIGGAYGVDDALKAKANNVVSLSGLVFPHQLVRLILLEQLYRSFSILSGSKYHHD